MNIQKHSWLIGPFILVIVLFGSFTAVRHTAANTPIRHGTYEKESQRFEISTAALPASEEWQREVTAVLTDLQTGFEAAEGFTAYTHCEQNGWTKFAASLTEGHIDTIHPVNGSQHVRISYDPGLAQGTLTGCFSPDLGPQPAVERLAQIDVAISDTGGADYDFVLQSPSQGLITARVKFYYLGDILVLDDDGAGRVEFIDTGVNWATGAYRTIRIEVNPGANTIAYYYDSSLIYTGSVFAGTTVEQAILMSDNWHMDDIGDFDNLIITTASTMPSSLIYLPAVMNPALPPDSPPVLDAIDNGDGDGSYMVSWSAVNHATNYILEESSSSEFSNATVVYSGSDTTTSISGQAEGTYYYRVKATNNAGSSDWSNSQSVEVTTTISYLPNIPCLLVIKRLSSQEISWLAGCVGSRGGPQHVVYRYDQFGRISGFDLTIEDSQGVIYYAATVDVERDGFGRVSTYDATISDGDLNGVEFPRFTEHIVNEYDPQDGSLDRADVTKVYLDFNDTYTMDFTPCSLGSSWVGYQVNVWGGPYNGELFTVGNCD